MGNQSGCRRAIVAHLSARCLKGCHFCCNLLLALNHLQPSGINWNCIPRAVMGPWTKNRVKTWCSFHVWGQCRSCILGEMCGYGCGDSQQVAGRNQKKLAGRHSSNTMSEAFTPSTLRCFTVAFAKQLLSCNSHSPIIRVSSKFKLEGNDKRLF